ncbi:MAG: lipoyl(octanoyl) transferase LipB [Desulfobacterales bacterium]|jgi:lipoate-protein ligase B
MRDDGRSGLFYLSELGAMDYADAQRLQIRCAAARQTGELDKDLLLLLEHPPVFTLGRNGGRENLTVSDAFLDKAGVGLVQAERGGNITYHGPGQLVGYPIVDMEARRLSVTDYVDRLEAVLIETAGAHGVVADRNPMNPGVWVDGAKLGSIGLCLRHGIAFHGFALNVTIDLTPFSWIHPCGLKHVAMTSLDRELGLSPEMDAVNASLKRAFAGAFGVDWVRLDRPALDALIGGGFPTADGEKEIEHGS